MSIKLRPFSEVEKTIGGRPKLEEPKVRLSFYVSQEEADHLKAMSAQVARPVSQIIRLIVRHHLSSGKSVE